MPGKHSGIKWICGTPQHKLWHMITTEKYAHGPHHANTGFRIFVTVIPKGGSASKCLDKPSFGMTQSRKLTWSLKTIFQLMPTKGRFWWTNIWINRDGNYRKILPFLRKSIEKICLSIIIFAKKVLPVHQNFYLSQIGGQSVISIPVFSSIEMG